MISCRKSKTPDAGERRPYAPLFGDGIELIMLDKYAAETGLTVAIEAKGVPAGRI